MCGILGQLQMLPMLCSVKKKSKCKVVGSLNCVTKKRLFQSNQPAARRLCQEQEKGVGKTYSQRIIRDREYTKQRD